MLRTHRLILRAVPEDAVQVVVGYLLAQGFTVYDDMDAAVRREESGWVATAVHIGEHSGFVRGMVNGLIEETGLMLIPGLKRNIPPTLVVTAARWLPDGTCELLVCALPSLDFKRILIDHDDDSLAGPRYQAAVQGAIAAFQAAGTFIGDHWFPKLEPDCPATPKRARELTGWR